MKVLYVTGACLTKNTSANMSHNAFVKGLIDCGADVDILMANSSWGEEDKALPKWEKAKYYEYNSISFADKMRKRFKKTEIMRSTSINQDTKNGNNLEKPTSKSIARIILKRGFYLFFPQDPVYPLEKTWIRNAKKFSSKTEYDVVISNSSPAASHTIVDVLLETKHVICKRWIQVWEDPWFYDLYGGHTSKIQKEEHYLLQKAQEVYYVSPLTLMYQKKYYSDCADKMKCIPLPFLEFGDNKKNVDTIANYSFGYFGDYYSKTRNILPFYEALKETEYEGYIFGDSDLALKATEHIKVSGRVTLDVLAGIQEQAKVLVHLCNLSGGQIPGKIYHYSATDKPILFILDGTEEEQENILKFFSNFNRYYFCKNDKDSICGAMKKIIEEKEKFERVVEFEPREVVRRILKKE